MWNLVILFIVTSFLDYNDARRYRTCEEGCCVHEYCAYHRICYPRIHCGLGCPDGQCVGQDQHPSGPDPQPDVVRQPLVSSSSRNRHGLDVPRESQTLSERYSYQDSPGNDIGASNTENNIEKDQAKSDDFKSTSADTDTSARSPVEVTNGICMPYQPCVEGVFCGLGHSCTFNYNLGYHVCQYNLDIGSTLCYDNKGRPALQSLS